MTLTYKLDLIVSKVILFESYIPSTQTHTHTVVRLLDLDHRVVGQTCELTVSKCTTLDVLNSTVVKADKRNFQHFLRDKYCFRQHD